MPDGKCTPNESAITLNEALIASGLGDYLPWVEQVQVVETEDQGSEGESDESPVRRKNEPHAKFEFTNRGLTYQLSGRISLRNGNILAFITLLTIILNMLLHYAQFLVDLFQR